jgi:TonB family protein
MTRVLGTALLVLATMGQPPATARDDKADCTMPQAARVWTPITAAVLERRVEPEWPAILRSARVEATLFLDTWIDAQGRVACVKVVRSIPLLDAAVVAAVQQWTFKPARLGKTPIAVVQRVAVHYPPKKPK